MSIKVLYLWVRPCSLGHDVLEGDHIPPLESHGQTLKQEGCFSGIFSDCGDASANLSCQLNGHLMPCTSCLHGKWVEDVCTAQIGVYLSVIFCAALWAAAPGVVDVFIMWDSA